MSKSKLILVLVVTATLGTLLATASGAIGSRSGTDRRAATPVFSDFKRFVRDIQGDRNYTVWASAHPKELVRWRTFRNALLALGNGGIQVPTVPKMTTPLGRELADVGRLYIDATKGLSGGPAPAPS
jgi:hypothetical protein